MRNERIRPSVYRLAVILIIIISFPSPTHSFIPGLKLSFSANPSHTAAFPFLLQDRLYGFPRLLLLLLSISIFTFYFFSVLHFLVVVSVR